MTIDQYILDVIVFFLQRPIIGIVTLLFLTVLLLADFASHDAKMLSKPVVFFLFTGFQPGGNSFSSGFV